MCADVRITYEPLRNSLIRSRAYCKMFWLWLCTQCRPVWSPGRRCWSPWRSEGGRISWGSPSWIQAAVRGSGLLHRWEDPAGRQGAEPAWCPSFWVAFWHPSCWFPLEVQRFCCAKVWWRYLFKPLGAPLLLTSTARKKRSKTVAPKDVRAAATEGPLPHLCVYPRVVGQTTALIFLVTTHASTLNCLLIIILVQVVI